MPRGIAKKMPSCPPLKYLAPVPFTSEAMTDFVNKRPLGTLTVVSDGLVCITASAQAGLHDRIVVSAGDPRTA